MSHPTPDAPQRAPKSRAERLVDRLDLFAIILSFAFIGLFAAHVDNVDVTDATTVVGLLFCATVIVKNIIWFRYVRYAERPKQTGGRS